MLTPGCLAVYTITTGERTHRVLARFMGARPESGNKRFQVLFAQGDGMGHVWTVIRTSVMPGKIQAIGEYVRERKIERMRR